MFHLDWSGSVSSYHYSVIIMGVMSSQITSLTIVYSTIYSDTDQRKHQSSTSLAFVWGINWWRVTSPHKWPVTRKMFPYDDVIMGPIITWSIFSKCDRRLGDWNFYMNDLHQTKYGFAIVYLFCSLASDGWEMLWYWRGCQFPAIDEMLTHLDLIKHSCGKII